LLQSQLIPSALGTLTQGIPSIKKISYSSTNRISASLIYVLVVITIRIAVDVKKDITDRVIMNINNFGSGTKVSDE